MRSGSSGRSAHPATSRTLVPSSLALLPVNPSAEALGTAAVARCCAAASVFPFLPDATSIDTVDITLVQSSTLLIIPTRAERWAGEQAGCSCSRCTQGRAPRASKLATPHSRETYFKAEARCRALTVSASSTALHVASSTTAVGGRQGKRPELLKRGARRRAPETESRAAPPRRSTHRRRKVPSAEGEDIMQRRIATSADHDPRGSSGAAEKRPRCRHGSRSEPMRAEGPCDPSHPS